MSDFAGAFCRVHRRLFLRAVTGAAFGLWLPSVACESDAQTLAEPWRVPPAPLPNCPPFLTPIAEHFRQYGGKAHVEGWRMPDLDDAFVLSVGGLCERELSVTLAELEADVERQCVVKTMVCVFGLHSTALWTGVPLRVLLERAGVDRAQAARLRFFGADGFENNLPLSAIYGEPAAMSFEPLIAFQVCGERLPRELGFPFRLLLVDRYGYKNIKWLERIEISDRDEPTGQYQQSGYSDAGLIEPLVAEAGLRLTETVPVGPLELCGFAVSGYAGIARVEISVDQQPYVAASLSSASDLREREPQLAEAAQLRDASGPSGLPGVWSAFRFQLYAEPGEQRICIRVRDASGRTADGAELRIIGRS